MNFSGFFYVIFFCLTIEGSKTFDDTFTYKWEFVSICKTYNFMDGTGCHPCALEKCKLIRVKANVKCQIFNCVVTTSTTSSAPTSSTTTTTTTTTTTATKTTSTTTTTTTTTATTEMQIKIQNNLLKLFIKDLFKLIF